MNTCLYRWYTYNNKKIRALQGKVFDVGGKSIFYRDVHEHKSRLWLDEGAWNLDYRTFEWLRRNGVQEIHYFWHKDRKLYRTTYSDPWIKSTTDVSDVDFDQPFSINQDVRSRLKDIFYTKIAPDYATGNAALA